MSVQHSILELHVSLNRRVSDALLPLGVTRNPVIPELGANDSPLARIFFYDETSGSAVNVTFDDTTDFELAVQPRNNVGSDPLWDCEVFQKKTESGGLGRSFYEGQLTSYPDLIATYMAARDDRPITLQIKTGTNGAGSSSKKTIVNASANCLKDCAFAPGESADEIENGGNA